VGSEMCIRDRGVKSYYEVGDRYLVEDTNNTGGIDYGK